MKEMRRKVQVTIETLGESQDKLEEIAYEMLNLSDIIRNNSLETKEMIEQLFLADSMEKRKEAAQFVKGSLDKVIEASEELSYYVHLNEEHFAIQRECIEEAKQMCDFIHCFLDGIL